MKHSKLWAPEAVRRVRIREKTKVGEYLVVDDARGAPLDRPDGRARAPYLELDRRPARGAGPASCSTSTPARRSAGPRWWPRGAARPRRAPGARARAIREDHRRRRAARRHRRSCPSGAWRSASRSRAALAQAIVAPRSAAASPIAFAKRRPRAEDPARLPPQQPDEHLGRRVLHARPPRRAGLGAARLGRALAAVSPGAASRSGRCRAGSRALGARTPGPVTTGRAARSHASRLDAVASPALA